MNTEDLTTLIEIEINSAISKIIKSGPNNKVVHYHAEQILKMLKEEGALK